jgi:hypothetical protein
MYYGKADDMEVKQTVGGNHAITYAQSVINAHSGIDNTPPTIFNPQRFPYNPGGTGFGPLCKYTVTQMPNDFDIWTYVYDVSGLQTVTLKYRTDKDGISDNDNATYAGGSGVNAWNSIPMTKKVSATGNVTGDPEINFFILPKAIADLYYAPITGLSNMLVDYYIEATDAKGNIARSAIQHVFVGNGKQAKILLPGGEAIAHFSFQMNRSKHRLFISFCPTYGDPWRVDVINTLGRRIAGATVPAGEHSLAMATEKWPSGVYVVRLIENGELRSVKKFVR